MAGRWGICGGGGQPVRVVHGDGQVLSLSPPVKVADILISHPHHYICHMSPELPSNKSSMLALDYDLEPGCLYFLLPLPRLFPTSSAGPPSCCCRVSNHDTSLGDGRITPSRKFSDGGRQHFGMSPLRLTAVRQMMDRIGSPMRKAKKKVSPEFSRSPASSACTKLETSPLLSPMYGSSKHRKRPAGILTFSKKCSGSPRASPRASPKRAWANSAAQVSGKSGSRDAGRSFMEEILCSKWKPELGCISEADVVVPASEELRLCLDRRRLTFDAKLPRSQCSSPVRLADGYRVHGRERLPKSPRDDAYHDDRPGNHMSLGNYLFA